MEDFTHWDLWKMFICCTEAKESATERAKWYASVGKDSEFTYFTTEANKYGILCSKIQHKIDKIKTIQGEG